MIAKSTLYKVKDKTGAVVFRGNKKDQMRYFKTHGGQDAGLSLWIGVHD